MMAYATSCLKSSKVMDPTALSRTRATRLCKGRRTRSRLRWNAVCLDFPERFTTRHAHSRSRSSVMVMSSARWATGLRCMGFSMCHSGGL